MQLTTRKKAIGLGIALILCSCIEFSIKYFPTAFNIVSVQITADRLDVLKAADQIIHKNNWTIKNADSSASFDLDEEFKNYVELEGGGAKKFQEIIQKNIYQPYTWTTRQFMNNEKRENSLTFTPKGIPYGYKLEILDTAPGPGLSQSQAQKIAIQKAKNWQINLLDYKLIEHQQEKKPNSRIDHSFVYEFTKFNIKDSRFRLKFTVNGDQVTEISHYTFIPDAFNRKYHETRASNQLIATFSEIGILILYIIGGCMIGFFIFYKKNLLEIKKGAILGSIISGGLFLSNLNEWPLLWMNYDTALNKTNFIIQNIISFFSTFAIWTCIFALIIITAEAFTRSAFPKKLQFWKLFNPNLTGTNQIITQTILGYLTAAFNISFVIGFYIITTRWLGWWTPAETLSNPNLMATYFPWISPITNAFEAGVIEEALFRAVPLAAAILIAKKWGKKPFWITLAFITQILIFSAAHATYQSIPGYSRLIELMIPSSILGALYLYAGLYPCILAHSIYDLILMSIPIFATDLKTALLDKLIIITTAISPILIILLAKRYQSRHPKTEITHFQNLNWHPASPKSNAVTNDFTTPPLQIPQFNRILITGIAIIAAITYITLTPQKCDLPKMRISRTQAISLAKTALESEKNIKITPPWQMLTSIKEPQTTNQTIIWQTNPPTTYQKLISTHFIVPNYWQIRAVKLTGSTEERANEYQVNIGPTGNIISITHILPEAASRDSLSQEDAIKTAKKIALTQLSISPTNLTQTAVNQIKRPNRTDWEIIFTDTAIPLSQNIQARIQIQISGSEITQTTPFIYIPESIERHQKNQQATNQIIQSIAQVAFIFIISIGLILLITKTKNQKNIKKWISILSLLMLLVIINHINNFPKILAMLSTDQPFTSQLIILISSSILLQTILVLGLSGICLYIYQTTLIKNQTSPQPSNSSQHHRTAIAASIIILGILSITAHIKSIWIPPANPIDSLSSYIPIIGLITKNTIRYLLTVSFIVILSELITTWWYHSNKIYRALSIVLLSSAGFICQALLGIITIPIFLLQGTTLSIGWGILFSLYLKYSQKHLPLIITIIYIATNLSAYSTTPYPTALTDYLILAAWLLGIWYFIFNYPKSAQ